LVLPGGLPQHVPLGHPPCPIRSARAEPAARFVVSNAAGFERCRDDRRSRSTITAAAAEPTPGSRPPRRRRSRGRRGRALLLEAREHLLRGRIPRSDCECPTRRRARPLDLPRLLLELGLGRPQVRITGIELQRKPEVVPRLVDLRRLTLESQARPQIRL